MTNEETGLDDNKTPKNERITRSEWKAITDAKKAMGFPDHTTGPMSVAGVDALVPPEMLALIIKRQANFPHDETDNKDHQRSAIHRLQSERIALWKAVDLMPDDMPDDPLPPPTEKKPKRAKGKRPSRKKGNK